MLLFWRASPAAAAAAAAAIAATVASFASSSLFAVVAAVPFAHSRATASSQTVFSTGPHSPARSLAAADDDYDYCKAGIPSPENYREPKNAELKGVVLITRHGDRTPTKSYPFENVTWNDCDVPDISYLSGDPGNLFVQAIVTPPNSPFAKTTWSGNCIPGQLTSKGMLTHRELGSALRSIYVDRLGFIPESMNDTVKDALYVRSTNVWRTVQSAKSMLQGLYPASRDVDNSHPILIQTYHPDVETMDSKLFCKRYKNLKNAMPDDPRFRNHMLTHIKLAERLDGILHMDPPSIQRDDGFRDLADGLACRLCHQKPMPCDPDNPQKCVSEADARKAMDMHQWEYLFGYRDYNKEQNALGIGFFFGELVDVFEHLAFGTDSPGTTPFSTPVQPGRFRFYSAHDSTLASILGALEPSELRWPPFRSNLIIELWRRTDIPASKFTEEGISAFFIRMIYNGRIPTFYQRWCDMNRCPLNVFLRRLNDVVPKDPIAACRGDSGSAPADEAPGKESSIEQTRT